MHYFKENLKLFEKHLEEYKKKLHLKEPPELYKPESYILSLGGKRVRPLLALMACELFKKQPKLALNSAMCVELFHNFSLIHDDILDAAPLRRNKKTVHEKWNTNIAILSGDVMLVKAFEILQTYSDSEFKKLIFVFSDTAIKVCEGQQMDMNFETRKRVKVEEYIQMITYKTAVLLGCSLQMGAINAGASTGDQKNLYEFGKHIGIAFQLLDDLLDAFADDPQKFGKQVGGDIISNKKTFLLLKAIEISNAKQHHKIKSLLELKIEKAKEKVSGMLEVFNELNVKELCKQEADKHTKLALDYLFKVKADAERKNELQLFAIHLLNRTV